MIKKIDSFIIKSFIPPFVVTFMIALFALVMQFLWLYIDDFVGKGLNIFLIMELIGYRAVALIPMALPLAILISSVMVFGNLGERYELASFKSGGISLLRIMRGLIYFGLFSVVFSYVCNDFLIPEATLKFGSRLFDIQEQKAALQLDEGVFNDDFYGYSIHIDKKLPDGQTVEGVKVYDHAGSAKGLLRSTLAKKGVMKTTEDGNYFMLLLEDGSQYEESSPKKKSKGSGQSYPFRRINFDRLVKMFDLSEFDLGRSDENRFKKSKNVLSFAELHSAADTLQIRTDNRIHDLSQYMANYFYYIKKDEKAVVDSLVQQKINPINKDTAAVAAKQKDSTNMAQAITPPQPNTKTPLKKIAAKKKNNKALKKVTKPRKKIKIQRYKQDLTHLEQDTTFVQTFVEGDVNRLFTKAESNARSVRSQARATSRTVGSLRESRVKHIYDIHQKYAAAIVCLIFVFVGAPLGAIVRKGGFGYPLLISVGIFIAFVVLTILFKKVAESFLIPAMTAAWIPAAIMFVLALISTLYGLNDSKGLGLKAFFKQ